MEKMEDELDESMILEGSDVDQEFDGDDEDANSRRNKRMLSGRGVTLNMLINDKILEPGNGHLTIDYLGAKFVGDLLPEGKIRWQESKEVFSSPSAWAIHCKKLLNPDRKPGCGWSSIKYRGKKLDHYKAAWFRKHKNNPALGLSPLVGMANMGNLVPQPMSFPTVPEQVPPTTSRSNNQRSKQDTGCRPGDRIIMNHALLGNRCIEHNANTQVLATPFSALDRIQPFTVTIATNCLLLMDFHCHLTKSEVVGYLGGTWDIASHSNYIYYGQEVISSLLGRRLGDTESSTAVEEEIQQSLERRNLTLVGWYHSHPNSKRQPTIRDIDNQLEYQIIMKGDCDSSYTPCIGLICSPFSIEKGLEADYLAYWVMPPPEHRPNEYGKPMEMVYNVANDSFLTQDLLMEMRQLADYYRGAPDVTNFKSEFKGKERIHTFWEKIKASLTVKLPRDLQVTGGQPAAHLQAVNHFWEFVKGLILV